MRGALLPLPQYAFVAWCTVKLQGRLYFITVIVRGRLVLTLLQGINCSACMLVCWFSVRNLSKRNMIMKCFTDEAKGKNFEGLNGRDNRC